MVVINGRRLVALGLLLVCGRLASEEFRVTTAYPSPAGVYKRVTTTGMTVLARDKGFVGVGTTDPKVPLDVAGLIRPGRSDTDPPGVEGGIYFNTVAHKFKAYRAGVWTDLAVSTGSGIPKHVQVFGAGDATFVVPDGVTRLRVEVFGAGGGGGGTRSWLLGRGGGGGGAGAVAVSLLDVQPRQNISFSVGAGGAGGGSKSESGGNRIGPFPGQPGGPSSFGGLVTAEGGGGGQSRGDGGSGATARGDIVFSGSGGRMSPENRPFECDSGGDGGFNRYGKGGQGGANNMPGASGNPFGGGGGGGGCGDRQDNSTPGQGGSGGDGRIIVWW